MKKTSAKAMMNPKGGKGMGTGGKTKDPADKKGPMGPKSMAGGKISATTKNKKYC
jgi:hypothetical protein